MQLVRPAARRLRQAARADGAGPSGLSQLLGVHSLQAAGDALVAVALAGTLFFSVPLGEARGRVALYLLLTLLPFSFLVPVAGPLLDRLRHGRRNVLAATAGGRGLLTWVMAGAIAGLGLYPLALGVLVLARAYGVARSAATPRVRPQGMTLIQANARLNVAATAASSLAAAVGGLVAKTLGASWVLYGASFLLLAAGVLALRLPEHVDEAREVEERSSYRLRAAGGTVLAALGSAAALRAVAGLLTIFLAFLLRETRASVWEIALVIGAAAAGQIGGTIGAARIRRVSAKAATRLSPLLALLACLAAAIRPHGPLPAIAAGVAAFVSSMSKFGLDASLQTEVPARSVSSAFAQSETALQLTWVLGAAIALVLPASGSVGFAVATALAGGGAVAAFRAPR